MCLAQPCHFTDGETEVDYWCSVMGWGVLYPARRLEASQSRALCLSLASPRETAERHSRLRKPRLQGAPRRSRGLEGRWEGCTAGKETVALKGLFPERDPQRDVWPESWLPSHQVSYISMGLGTEPFLRAGPGFNHSPAL